MWATLLSLVPINFLSLNSNCNTSSYDFQKTLGFSIFYREWLTLKGIFVLVQDFPVEVSLRITEHRVSLKSSNSLKDYFQIALLSKEKYFLISCSTEKLL